MSTTFNWFSTNKQNEKESTTKKNVINKRLFLGCELIGRLSDYK